MKIMDYLKIVMYCLDTIASYSLNNKNAELSEGNAYFIYSNTGNFLHECRMPRV